MIMLKDDESGQVQISDDVIAVIANTAALEIDGVVATESNFTENIADLLRKKNFARGVKVETDDAEIKILINLFVKFGYKIPEVTLEVQKKIKSAIEMMTGLIVSEVNVNITGINFEKEKKIDKKSKRNE